jgi:fatty acid-binding protein DegV
LKIKPVLHIGKSTNGKVDVLDKVRTMKRAQDRVINHFCLFYRALETTKNVYTLFVFLQHLDLLP